MSTRAPSALVASALAFAPAAHASPVASSADQPSVSSLTSARGETTASALDAAIDSVSHVFDGAAAVDAGVSQRMRVTPVVPVVVYVLAAAASGAGVALGLVSLFCFPEGSPVPAQLAPLALILVGVALCAVAALALFCARQERIVGRR